MGGFMTGVRQWNKDEEIYHAHPITKAFMKTSCRKDITEKRRTQAHIEYMEAMLKCGAVHDVYQGMKTLANLKNKYALYD